MERDPNIENEGERGNMERPEATNPEMELHLKAALPIWKLVERVQSYFMEHPSVRGLALVGSLAGQDPLHIDEYSDADLLLCVEDKSFDELMKGDWLDHIGEVILAFPKVVRDEFRVIYEGFLNCDFHLMTVRQMKEAAGACELGAHLSTGFRILFDHDQLLEQMVNRVKYESPTATREDYEVVAGVFWHNMFFLVGLVERGDLYRAYSLCNRYLQHWLLELIYDVDAPGAMKCLHEKISPEYYQRLQSCFARLDQEDMVRGLRNCMETFWFFQQKHFPKMAAHHLASFRRVEEEVLRRLHALEARGSSL